jgi:hypothetical protein
MLLWAVVAGEEPWREVPGAIHEMPTLISRIMNRAWPPLDRLAAPDCLKELIAACWDIPEHRPTFREIYNALADPAYWLEGTDAAQYGAYIAKLTGAENGRTVAVRLKLGNRIIEYRGRPTDQWADVGSDIAGKVGMKGEGLAFYTGESDEEKLEGPIWPYRKGQTVRVRVQSSARKWRIVAGEAAREVEIPEIIDGRVLRELIARKWGLLESNIMMREGTLDEVRIDVAQRE